MNAMASERLPNYLTSAKRNPPQNRAPWYMNTAPAYAGVFLWVVFYETLGNVLQLGGLAAAMVGLALAAVGCYFLFYLVYGLLGMQTGLPLYVVGSSTFGARGGYFVPGILMGLLQVGWYKVWLTRSDDHTARLRT
jgi:cytosine permease